MTDETRVNLSALRADDAALERTAANVAARIAPTLRRRRERVPLLWLGVAEWRRPVLAAAALVVIASALVILRPEPRTAAFASASVARAASTTLAEAAGVPAPVASYLEVGTAPSGDALLGLQEAP